MNKPHISSETAFALITKSTQRFRVDLLDFHHLIKTFSNNQSLAIMKEITKTEKVIHNFRDQLHEILIQEVD